MSITNELREYARALFRTKPNSNPLTEIADSIDKAHDGVLAEQRESLTTGMTPMTDENMAEHGWVRGPLDADGEMWHSGDMSDSSWGVIECIAYEKGKWYICGHDISAPWIPADSIRHYHGPTVEDVLDEFASAYDRIGGEDEEHQKYLDLIAKYAEKLRVVVK